jgi:adenosylmethionine-8-amino-7-oxononanoate aminotransferase
MNRGTIGRTFSLAAVAFVFFAGWVFGQQTASQKRLVHAFAYTAEAAATAEDFANLKTATDALVGKIPGLTKVWTGKLLQPLDAGANVPKRTHGIVMEFENEAALKAYGDHPEHKVWERVYRKVRVPGTTTFDIVVE